MVQPDRVTLFDSTWTGGIHISNSASGDIENLASDVQRILTAATGSSISIDNNPAEPGILLGTYQDWAADNYGFERSNYIHSRLISKRRDYVIVSVGERVLILGRTPRMTAFAAYRFLELLGYAQLLPTEVWEIIPSLDKLRARVAIAENTPLKFINALGDSGGIDEGDARDRLELWRLRNRVPAGKYTFGHAYGQIKNAYLAEFNAHPEWIGSVNKFCVLEEGLRRVVYQWVKEAIDDAPDIVVQKLAAADSALGWDTVCIGTNEQATYTPSDRQIILANHIQERISETGVRLSVLAYGATSEPPNIKIDPRIVIGVTDGYIESGMTWDSVAAAYKKQGAVDIIPYAYTGAWTFQVGTPGTGRASKLDLMKIDADRAVYSGDTLRGLIAEGCPVWGLWGLGYWVLVKLCTNKRIRDTSVLRDEYMRLAFGTGGAYAPMSELYSILEITSPLSEHMLHRLYDCLDRAIISNPSQEIKNRIYDLAIYVRYVELYYQWALDEEVTSFDAMVSWMWRAREHDLLPVRLSYSQPSNWQPWYQELKTLYPGYNFTWFSNKPWADKDIPFTEQELDTIILDGVDSNRLLSFTPVGFSTDLVYVERPTDNRARATYLYSNRDHSFYLWLNEDQDEWIVETRGGYSNDADGDAYLKVYEISSSELAATVPGIVDETHTYVVPLKASTLYRVDVEANSGVKWSCPGYATSKITDFSPSMYQGDFSGYFYVPAGTTTIGGYGGPALRFRNQSNQLVYTQPNAADYFSFDITPPSTGEIWKVENANGTFTLLTVPPAIAMHPSELLVPRELTE